MNKIEKEINSILDQVQERVMPKMIAKNFLMKIVDELNHKNKILKDAYTDQLLTIEGLVHERDLYSDQAKEKIAKLTDEDADIKAKQILNKYNTYPKFDTAAPMLPLENCIQAVKTALLGNYEDGVDNSNQSARFYAWCSYKGWKRTSRGDYIRKGEYLPKEEVFIKWQKEEAQQ